jgi:CTP:molybdopterin cytidylyltransferase MocA
MLNISTIAAGVAFVTLAATNIVVMLKASQPSGSAATRNRLIAAYRAGKYLFVILLCIMA